MAGEKFERTPKINSDAGRGHWPSCYSVLLASGGIRGGQVVGASDSTGAYPKERPVTPADIHAAVYAALGYDVRAITYESSDASHRADGGYAHQGAAVEVGLP